MIYSYRKRSNIPRNQKFVIESFLVGDTLRAKNLRSTGERIIHHDTVLLQHTDDGIIYNATGYSQSSKKTQYLIREYLNPKDPIYMTHDSVPLGVYDLAPHVITPEQEELKLIDKIGRRIIVTTHYGFEFNGILEGVDKNHIVLSTLWKSFTPIVNSQDPTAKTVINRVNIKKVKKFSGHKQERNYKNKEVDSDE